MRIAFLSRVSHPFNGDTVKRAPLGGTQSALVYLARELQARGHEVHVFCHGEPGVFDGVSYHPVPELARFARQHALDAFVPCADESALALGIRSRHTLWWSHNDYAFLWDEMPDLRAKMAAALATRADKLIAVSQWHADKLAEVFQIPASHFWVTRNGVHWPYFEADPTPALPPRLIYSSVPDRGLDLLLDFFPRLRAQVPELELHLYSSFTVWGKSAAWDLAHAGPLYQRALDLEGVFLHRPVAQAELAAAMRQGSLFVYPNHPAPVDTTGFWAETSCISALEAQAAGLPVITSARGALPETVRDGETGLLIPGDPFSSDYAEAFISATVGLLQDPVRRLQMSEAARAHIQARHTWPQIAAEWEAFLAEMVSTRLAQAPLSSTFATPQISVVIPTYNRARNLRNCLESLTWQTLSAFEVIVCDDGSSDDTPEVVASFQTRLNLRYRWQPDQGFRAAEARNMGIRAARSPLLVFLDSDLVVPDTFLAAHAEAHRRYPNVAVNSYVYRQREPDDHELGLPPQSYIPRHLDNLRPDTHDRYQLFERGGPVAETYSLDSNALSLRRADLDKIGGFDGSFVGWGCEDTELGYRLAEHGMQLLFIKEGTEAYHQHHVFAEDRDAQRLVNWQRLTQKHGIKGWYDPLWELPVSGWVQLDLQGEAPAGAPLLPLWLEAEWTLKTGHLFPLADLHYVLTLEQGTVTAISPYLSGGVY
ncbi:MAG: glycosyltransferase [Candidatus Sericytochromatia bacterium]